MTAAGTFPPPVTMVRANVQASGVELADDTLKAIDEALGGVPVTTPTLAPFAEEGVRHRV